MLVIKLVRYGKKNLPSFRVALTNGNKVVEFLGSYYPHPKSPQLEISKELLEKWQKSGAQLSPAVEKLIKGKYEFKKYVPKKAESAEVAAPAAAMPPEAAAPVTEEPQPTEEPKPEVEQENPPENA